METSRQPLMQENHLAYRLLILFYASNRIAYATMTCGIHNNWQWDVGFPHEHAYARPSDRVALLKLSNRSGNLEVESPWTTALRPLEPAEGFVAYHPSCLGNLL